MKLFLHVFVPCILTYASLLHATQDLESIEKITVTSSLRLQSLDEISNSATVIDQEQIESRQATHLEEILNLSPNVNFASGASRGRFVQIRGIGERSQFAEPVNPSVGLVVDDFDFSGLGAVGTLFDAKQVEILKGPQSTEFGAAGMAGTIKIKTNEADGKEQPFLLKGTLAQNNSWEMGLAGGGGYSESIFYRVALHQYKSDGFIHNTYLDSQSTDNLDEFTGRLKFAYLPSDQLSIRLNFQVFDIDNGYDAFSLDNIRETLSDQPGFDRQKSKAAGLQVDYEFESAHLLGMLNQANSETAYGYDEDWTYTGFHPSEYSSFDAYYRDRDVTSAELRILSTEKSKIFSNTTQWLVGAFIKRTDESLLRQYTYNESDFTSQYKPDSQSIYSELETSLSEQLSVKFGLRIEDFEIEYSDVTGFEEQTKDTLIGAKLSLNYTNGNARVYSLISRGFKAGGFNPDQRVVQENRIFEPEYNWNYEIGVHGHLPEWKTKLRLTAFYMERKNTQVSDFDVETREDGTSTFIDIIGNADTGTNLGLEIEGSWQVNEELELLGSYGYLDATFSGYTLADGTQIDKQEQAQAPKHTWSLIAAYNMTESIMFKLDVEGKDDFRFSDGHDERAPFTVLVNLSGQYQMDDWGVTLWAKNLLDRKYYVRGFGGFNNDPRDGYDPAEPYYQLGDGRQVGLTVRYQY